MQFREPIAIVGIAGIFPGALELETFWNNIQNSICSSREIPSSRWALPVGEIYSKGSVKPDKAYSYKGCVIENFTLDSKNLKIDGISWEKLDPLYKLCLAVGQKAFLDVVGEMPSRERVGVILGNIALPTEKSSAISWEILGRTYAEKAKLQFVSENTDMTNRYVTGLPASLLAKALQLGGGTFTLDAACASSLYAIQLASQELLQGRMDAVISGGVSRPDCLYTQMGFSQLHALAPEGLCAPFDYKQSGLVIGEGAGMFVLKRLSDAIRQKDRIYATIQAIGISNDRGGELLAPAVEGQLRAMQQAYQDAGWNPDAVDLIECHATGTPVGDAVELESLKRLWEGQNAKNRPCVIGSVKSNIGHALTAAGAAGLLKVLLSFQHQTLPPTAHFEREAPGATLTGSPFCVLNQSRRWDKRSPDMPRRAAVSAFGFGGINAHVLVEEWDGSNSYDIKPLPEVKQPCTIAVVGMDAHFGPFVGIEAFSKRIFNHDKTQPEKKKNWFGVEESRWFKNEYPQAHFQGFGIEEFSIPLGEFRIPPKEIQEMLPQQVLMLQIAKGAMKDAKALAMDHLRSGVFIGIAHDLNTGNFHVRWVVQKWADSLAKEFGLSPEEKEKWILDLKDSLFPALNANRTMGALGSIVASRIAREFKFGGPSFTVSNEDASSMVALNIAIRKLQEKEIDLALAGGVDFAGDIRSLAGKASDVPFGEGAGAVVLKRWEDAQRDKDKIYCTIQGTGNASSTTLVFPSPDSKAYTLALERAWEESLCSRPGYFDASTTGYWPQDKNEIQALHSFLKQQEICALGSTRIDIGHAGAASGIASFIKTALCLYHKVMPVNQGKSLSMPKSFYPLSSQARAWLRNRVEGERTASLLCSSCDGNVHCMVLQENKENLDHFAIASDTGSGLFAIQGSEIQESLDSFQAWLKESSETSIERLAQSWYQKNTINQEAKHTIAFVSQNKNHILAQVQTARKSLSESSYSSLKAQGIYYTPSPLGPDAKIAFVFPGVGNQYPGMGRELALLFPEILERLDQENECLHDQMLPEVFWADSIPEKLPHKALLLGHVTMGSMVSDILLKLGIYPQAAIGYSLGETTSLFALRAWKDRNLMLQRLYDSPLFQGELDFPYNAAKRFYHLPEDAHYEWIVGVLGIAKEEAEKILPKYPRAYILMKNTRNECVIGGERSQVKELVQELGCLYFPVDGTSIAHCKILQEVKDQYHDFHLFPTFAPQGIDFYSGNWGKRYELSKENAADSILSHALYGVDFPKTIESSYADGIRIFIETGPGASCTRMIGNILEGKDHLVCSVCPGKQSEVSSLLNLAAILLSERIPVDIGFLYARQGKEKEKKSTAILSIATGKSSFDVVVPEAKKKSATPIQDVVKSTIPKPIVENLTLENTEKPMIPILKKPKETRVPSFVAQYSLEDVLQQWQNTQTSRTQAHEAYLQFQQSMNQIFSQMSAWQISQIASFEGKGDSIPFALESETLQPQEPVVEDQPSLNIPAPLLWKDPDSKPIAKQPENLTEKPALDRSQCLEFAVGSIARVLGEKFSQVDSHPTRVRLPAEPLMLVDRIMKIEGEPCSMTQGRVITEHDILPGSWYLDNNRIPTCVAVEAGQADLFLSGYLGIDLKTKGLAVYRLLDAQVTFHAHLPEPGKIIHYDIQILRFFLHEGTYFFYFQFDSTVDGKPLLTMRNGCAGFFTMEQLEKGEGVVHSRLDTCPLPGKKPKDWQEIVPMVVASYSDKQIDALRKGNLEECFGPEFEGLKLRKPLTIPGGKMKLVDRVLFLDPQGGRYGLGLIRGQADIHPDDWFLTCHFCDDNVMPGTLMYECCMHTLRIFLLRMGWVAETENAVWQPIPEISSTLKCRGQVIATTRKADYEISIKEIGYGPEPYAIADALMYADGKPIVEIINMTIRLSGTTQEKIHALWQKARENRGTVPGSKTAPIYDFNRILAFAVGKPSEAFGEPYRIFDEKRTIARLPGPPYQFLDRITSIQAEPWKMQAGGIIEAQYDVPPDAWYFNDNQQPYIPFAVLLEIGLQPCGWLAAYIGSALTSETDLSFRNLGGSAVYLHPVGRNSGTLTTQVKITKVASSVGMIIQHYDFRMTCQNQYVYQGNTYFGFFSKAALSNQVGITDAKLYQPTAEQLRHAISCDYPKEAGFPKADLRMISHIQTYIPNAGPFGLGYIQGTLPVNPDSWYFKAHFYQDPVIPGSLGLESALQLMRFIAWKRWNALSTTTVSPGMLHEWTYRGQIIPKDSKVTVSLWITSIDNLHKIMVAEGYLSIDGRVIYHLKDFSLRAEKI
ncbi:MAG: type I polyketide synthase [Candidatus Brocadiae bacterium]|nr:type I polyketide synthase [Candidatus Brocadiia bacterium]